MATQFASLKKYLEGPLPATVSSSDIAAVRRLIASLEKRPLLSSPVLSSPQRSSPPKAAGLPHRNSPKDQPPHATSTLATGADRLASLTRRRDGAKHGTHSISRTRPEKSAVHPSPPVTSTATRPTTAILKAAPTAAPSAPSAPKVEATKLNTKVYATTTPSAAAVTSQIAARPPNPSKPALDTHRTFARIRARDAAASGIEHNSEATATNNATMYAHGLVKTFPFVDHSRDAMRDILYPVDSRPAAIPSAKPAKSIVQPPPVPVHHYTQAPPVEMPKPATATERAIQRASRQQSRSLTRHTAKSRGSQSQKRAKTPDWTSTLRNASSGESFSGGAHVENLPHSYIPVLAAHVQSDWLALASINTGKSRPLNQAVQTRKETPAPSLPKPPPQNAEALVPKGGGVPRYLRSVRSKIADQVRADKFIRVHSSASPVLVLRPVDDGSQDHEDLPQRDDDNCRPTGEPLLQAERSEASPTSGPLLGETDNNPHSHSEEPPMKAASEADDSPTQAADEPPGASGSTMLAPSSLPGMDDRATHVVSTEAMCPSKEPQQNPSVKQDAVTRKMVSSAEIDASLRSSVAPSSTVIAIPAVPPKPSVRAAIAWSVPTAELNKKVDLYGQTAIPQHRPKGTYPQPRPKESARDISEFIPRDLPMFDVTVNVNGFRRHIPRADPLEGTKQSLEPTPAAVAESMLGKQKKHASTVAESVQVDLDDKGVGQDARATSAPDLRRVGAPQAPTIQQKARAVLDALASAATAADDPKCPQPSMPFRPPLSSNSVVLTGTAVPVHDSNPASRLPTLPVAMPKGRRKSVESSSQQAQEHRLDAPAPVPSHDSLDEHSERSVVNAADDRDEDESLSIHSLPDDA